jgi:hypothetical protein
VPTAHLSRYKRGIAPVAGQRLGVRAGALRRAGGNARRWDLAASDHVAILELDLE